jgi:hypothetical protein
LEVFEEEELMEVPQMVLVVDRVVDIVEDKHIAMADKFMLEVEVAVLATLDLLLHKLVLCFKEKVVLVV